MCKEYIRSILGEKKSTKVLVDFNDNLSNPRLNEMALTYFVFCIIRSVISDSALATTMISEVSSVEHNSSAVYYT